MSEESSLLRTSETNQLVAKLNRLMAEHPMDPVRVMHSIYDDAPAGSIIVSDLIDVKLDKLIEVDGPNPAHLLPGLYDYDDLMNDPLWGLEKNMESHAYDELMSEHGDMSESELEDYVRENLIKPMDWQDIIAVYIG